MPKLSVNQPRRRTLRTPPLDVLTKYEQIALLSVIYSQAEIVAKLHCSYGTIRTAFEFFQSKFKISAFQPEFTLLILPRTLANRNADRLLSIDQPDLIATIRLTGTFNRRNLFALEFPDTINQTVANWVLKNPNMVFDIKFRFLNYQFYTLNIVTIDEICAIFHALTPNFLSEIKTNYHPEFSTDNWSLQLLPNVIVDLKTYRRKRKPTGIATPNGIIFL